MRNFVLTKSVVLLFVLLCSTSNASAQGVETVKSPDDIRGKRVSAFVTLLNSTGDEALREFVAKEMSPNPDLALKERVNPFRKLRENVGPATLRRVLDVGPEEINFLLETKKGEWLKVGLALDPDSQSHIPRLWRWVRATTPGAIVIACLAGSPVLKPTSGSLEQFIQLKTLTGVRKLIYVWTTSQNRLIAMLLRTSHIFS